MKAILKNCLAATMKTLMVFGVIQPEKSRSQQDRYHPCSSCFIFFLYLHHIQNTIFFFRRCITRDIITVIIVAVRRVCDDCLVSISFFWTFNTSKALLNSKHLLLLVWFSFPHRMCPFPPQESTSTSQKSFPFRKLFKPTSYYFTFDFETIAKSVEDVDYILSLSLLLVLNIVNNIFPNIFSTFLNHFKIKSKIIRSQSEFKKNRCLISKNPLSFYKQ